MLQAEKKSILIVDDHPRLVRLIQAILETRSFQVAGVCDGLTALQLVQERAPDLVILDLELPGLDGLEVCRHLRGFSTVPIIILSGRKEVEFMVEGLEAGADDYLTKPFHQQELVARVEAVLRRSSRKKPEQDRGVTKVGELEFDYTNYRINQAGVFKKLTPLEYRLLSYLAMHEGRLIPYTELINGVWGPAYSDNEKNLRVYICRLRAMLEPNNRSPQHIITVRDVGYMFLNN